MPQSALRLGSALIRSAAACQLRSYEALSSGFARSISTSSAVAFSSNGSSTATQAAADTASAAGGPPKMVVFGGRGFVGTAVCKEAVASGLSVVGISRGGTPPLLQAPWVDQVAWVRGNALEPATLTRHLQGVEAVVSCIGGFGSNEEMLKINGAANVSAIEAARAAGVKRFVFISAHIPNIPGIDRLLSGYIAGKQAAEEAVRAHFPATGVILRPWVITGDRIVSTNLTLPLGLAFKPLELLVDGLGLQQVRQLAGVPVVGAAFVPPVSVDVVGRTAVRAATDPLVPPGVIDVWELAAMK